MDKLSKLVAIYNKNSYRMDLITKNRFCETIEKLKTTKKISKQINQNADYLIKNYK